MQKQISLLGPSLVTPLARLRVCHLCRFIFILVDLKEQSVSVCMYVFLIHAKPATRASSIYAARLIFALVV
jgi:hypothetical protein